MSPTKMQLKQILHMITAQQAVKVVVLKVMNCQPGTLFFLRFGGRCSVARSEYYRKCEKKNEGLYKVAQNPKKRRYSPSELVH